MAILISDKVDLRGKDFDRERKGHYIIINGSMQQGSIAILNVYTPNNSVQSTWSRSDILLSLKGEIYKSKLAVGDSQQLVKQLDRKTTST